MNNKDLWEDGHKTTKLSNGKLLKIPHTIINGKPRIVIQCNNCRFRSENDVEIKCNHVTISCIWDDNEWQPNCVFARNGCYWFEGKK